MVGIMEDIGSIEIYNEVVQLKDLFQRRLLDDKVKLQVINELTTKLDDLRLMPLCREIVLLLDRLEKNSDCSENTSLNMVDFITSIYEELLAIFGHYGLEQVETSLVYNYASQRIISTVQDDETPDMMVAKSLRRGYKLNGTLLRPEEVVIVMNQGEGENAEPECG